MHIPLYMGNLQRHTVSDVVQHYFVLSTPRIANWRTLMYWRLGFPGWRLAAGIGLPIRIKVDVCKDDEANVYYATSDDIGLAVESGSLDELIKEIDLAVPELLELAHTPIERPRTDIRIHQNLAIA